VAAVETGSGAVGRGTSGGCHRARAIARTPRSSQTHRAIGVTVAILLEISVVTVRFVLRACVVCNHHILKPEMVENEHILDKLGVYFAITKSTPYIEIGKPTVGAEWQLKKTRNTASKSGNVGDEGRAAASTHAVRQSQRQEHVVCGDTRSVSATALRSAGPRLHQTQ
jgi:hypothetical protein